MAPARSRPKKIVFRGGVTSDRPQGIPPGPPMPSVQSHTDLNPAHVDANRVKLFVHLAVGAARDQREQAERQALASAQEAARRAAEEEDEYEFYDEEG